MSSEPDTGRSTVEQPDVAALYLRYRLTMQRVAASVLAGTGIDPADPVMRVVGNLQAKHRDGSLHGVDNWEAYLVTSVRNEAHDAARKSARESPVDDAELGALLAPTSSDTTENVATNLVEARRRLDRLDPRRRAIVEALYFDDVPLVQVAAQWQITTQRVGQLRDQALRTMREE